MTIVRATAFTSGSSSQRDLALLAYCGDIEPGLPSYILNFSRERGYISIREYCGHARIRASAEVG